MSFMVEAVEQPGAGHGGDREVFCLRHLRECLVLLIAEPDVEQPGRGIRASDGGPRRARRSCRASVKDKQVGLGYLVLQSLTPMRVGEWLAQLQRDDLSASRVRQA